MRPKTSTDVAYSDGVKAALPRDPEDARRRDPALSVAGSLAVLPDSPAALQQGIDTTPP